MDGTATWSAEAYEAELEAERIEDLADPFQTYSAIKQRIVSRRARYRPHALGPIGEAVQDTVEGRSKLLWHAAGQGRLGDVQRLAGSGGLVDHRDEYGATPLWIAAFYGHLEVVQWLAGNGGSVTRPDDDGAYPLFIAAQEGHFQLVQWLAGHRLVTVTQPDYGSIDGFLDSPITVAAFKKDGKMVVWLATHMLAQADSVTKPDNDGVTPHFVAAPEDHLAPRRAMPARTVTVDTAAMV